MTNREIGVQLVDLVGGKENIAGVTSCVSRCRVEIYEMDKVDRKGLEKLEGQME